MGWRYDEVTDGFEMAEEGEARVGYGEMLGFYVFGSECCVRTRRLASRESVASGWVEEDED